MDEDQPIKPKRTRRSGKKSPFGKGRTVSKNPTVPKPIKPEDAVKLRKIKKSVDKLGFIPDDDFEDEIKIFPKVVEEKNKKQFYLGDPQLKAINVKLEWTQKDIDEYQKCKDDVIYFIQNYMKIIHVDKGVVPFKMYDYQKKVIKIYEKNRFVTLKFPRQSGKTITTVGYLLHYVLFNEHKNVGILANRAKTARGILNRFRSSYRQLPFFLQSGVVEWNKGNVTLENGCVVFADATSEAASRSESISLLILDEFAFVENTKAEEFMKSVYPTITSGKTTKVFIFSTPNGMNHFYKLWMDAKDKRNGYIPYEIKWDDVPGRDEKFKQETIANVGEDAWRQEFECNFLGSAGSLISSTVLARMVYQIPVFSQEFLKIYEPPQPEHTYAMTVDPSEGLGLDYSCFVVTDVSEIPYRQVAIYRNDKIDPHVLPDIVFDIAKKYNNAFVLVEANNNGVIVCDILHETLEYDNLIQSATMGRAGQVAASGGFGVKTRIGVKTTPQSKRIGCSVCKSLVESDQYIVNDYDTLKEFTTFVQHLNSYQAEEGYNDDTVMCVVLFGWLINQPYFKEILHNSDIRKKLTEDSHLSQLLESVIPFGHIDDGTKQKENFDYNIPPDERDECAWIECGPWERLQNSGFYK